MVRRSIRDRIEHLAHQVHLPQPAIDTLGEALAHQAIEVVKPQHADLSGLGSRSLCVRGATCTLHVQRRHL